MWCIKTVFFLAQCTEYSRYNFLAAWYLMQLLHLSEGT